MARAALALSGEHRTMPRDLAVSLTVAQREVKRASLSAALSLLAEGLRENRARVCRLKEKNPSASAIDCRHLCRSSPRPVLPRDRV